MVAGDYTDRLLSDTSRCRKCTHRTFQLLVNGLCPKCKRKEDAKIPAKRSSNRRPKKQHMDVAISHGTLSRRVGIARAKQIFRDAKELRKGRNDHTG